MFRERVLDKMDSMPDREVLVGKENGKYLSYTYKDLKNMAGIIQNKLSGIDPEDRVVIFMENSPLWVASFFAVMFKGGINVPVDYLLSESELFNILRDAQPKYLITSKANREKAESAVSKLGYSVNILVADDLKSNEEYELEVFMAGKERVAVILYTSGTTGNPKGVMLTYKNLNHNVVSIEKTGILEKGDRFIAVLPFHHTYPLMGTVILPVVIGGTTVFIERLTPTEILSTMVEQNITILVGVPKLYQVIYNNILLEMGKLPKGKKKIVKTALSIFKKVKVKPVQKKLFQEVHKKIGPCLKYMISGGAKLNVDVAIGLESLGFNILEGYGLTETSPIASFNRPRRKKIGSAGLPIEGVKVKTVNGEIVVKGDNVMKGYFNRPEETVEVLKDGWFYTGDLGYLDDEGFVYITGRAKDVIVLDNGKNVYPEDIENEILKSYYISEIGVFELEGTIKAVVRPNFDLLEEEGIDNVVEFIKKEIKRTTKHLQSYKRVREFKITDKELPKTRIGKLRRFMLPDIYKELK